MRVLLMELLKLVFVVEIDFWEFTKRVLPVVIAMKWRFCSKRRRVYIYSFATIDNEIDKLE